MFRAHVREIINEQKKDVKKNLPKVKKGRTRNLRANGGAKKRKGVQVKRDKL